MAFATFSSGVAPTISDTRWDQWYKMLVEYQTQAGADPSNDPFISDTLWDLRRKLLNAIG